MFPVVFRWSVPSRIHFPASLGSTVVTRFFATTDALTPAGRCFGRFRPERRLVPAGLPDYRRSTSRHSVSNHRRVDRGSLGCQQVFPAATGFAFYQQTRPLTPTESSSRRFTLPGPLRYGLAVLVPLLSTSHCCDAVTVRFRTIRHRTEADSHRFVLLPSQAHWRSRPGCGFKGRPAPFCSWPRDAAGTCQHWFDRKASLPARPQPTRSPPHV
jgi:hypothetical protein